MRVIARKLEQMWWPEDRARRHDAIGLTWYDGVVHGVGDLCAGVNLSARELIVRGTSIDDTLVGRAISDFVDHPALDGLRIAEIAFAYDAFAEVRLDARPLPFTADGDLLPV